MPSMSGLRGERGQTSAEYVGMLLVVVAIIAAISYADIGAAITAQVERATCAIATDSGLEDCGGGAGPTAEGGAPVRAGPNLYASETLPGARRSLEGASGVPALLAAAKAEPAEEDLFDKALGLVDERSGFKDARKSWRALFEGDFKGALVHPLVPFAVPGGTLGDELLGPKDARQAIASLIDGNYGSALLSAAFAVPIGGKFLKGGKYAGKALAWLGRTGPSRALVARGRGALRRVLREERGSVGLPSARGARAVDAHSAAWRASAGSKPSRTLAKEMKAAGVKRPPDSAAHHMVAAGEKRYPEAREAQAKLKELKILPNDVANGVYLPCKRGACAEGAYHPPLHTQRYYTEVRNRLGRATGREDAIGILQQIRRELAADRFPK